MSDAPTRKKRPKPALARQHRRFLTEYLADFNAVRAAVRAGYKKRWASVHGWKLLRRPDIAAELESEMELRRGARRLMADRVLEEFARLAFLAEQGDAESGAAEAGGTQAGGAAPARQLNDRKHALNALARHLGLLQPPLQSQAATGSPEETIAGRDAREELRERLLRLARNGGS